jgi:hypothetical protein
MQQIIFLFGAFLSCLWGTLAVAQDKLPNCSLCDLQMQLKEGEHRVVRVEGVYLAGIKTDYLVAPECSIRSTYIQFDLRDRKNWKRLQDLISRSDTFKGIIGDGDPVSVVFEGEFYGPPMPDPKLPEAFRKAYQPSWDHNAMTKLVVCKINSVKLLPPDHPCASSKSRKWPCFQRNAYPPSKSEGTGNKEFGDKQRDSKSASMTSR